MAVRTHPIFFSFSGGEISPKLEGRIDLSQYQNGVKQLRNFICLPQGGAKSRGGFHFVTETKENGFARLIPFVFSELQNYMDEFGDQYIRFFMNRGQIVCEWSQSKYYGGGNIFQGSSWEGWRIPYEISTPYNFTDDLWLIDYAQGDEYLYLVHPDYPPMVLTRTDHEAWTISEIAFTWGDGGSPWSAEDGYPRTVCFHEGRILFASTYEQPQTIWGSKVGESGPNINMTPGSLDNDGYSFTASELNIIRWMYPGRLLSIGALSGEATAVGPSDGPITPLSPPRIKLETSHGSSNLVKPVKIGKGILFLQKAGRKIREFVYSFADDAYGAPDLTIASDHLFEAGIYDLVYQQEPDSILWAITGNEELLGCTYDRTQTPSIVGWHKHPTDGSLESSASIPYQSQDQLWAIIERVINGVPRGYIEYYDPDICVDSGLTHSGDPISDLEGLEHLAGKDVEIVGDGAVYPSQKVPNDGKITINPRSSEIYIGLGYTPRLITNRPEVSTEGGTSQGLKKRWNKIIVRVLDTMGIKINGQIIPARYGFDPMDKAPIPYSGDVSVENLGWDTDGRIMIEQPLPLPAHIVCITGSLVVGDD